MLNTLIKWPYKSPDRSLFRFHFSVKSVPSNLPPYLFLLLLKSPQSNELLVGISAVLGYTVGPALSMLGWWGGMLGQRSPN